MNKSLLPQIRILALIIMANFIAQIPYFIHLYYTPQHPFPNLRANLLMGFVFLLFLMGYILFARGKTVGYWLLVLFLSLEFLFYLYDALSSIVRGFGLFFQLSNPDYILRIIFAIGYLNLFASGYFLFLLFYKRKMLIKR